MRELRQTVVTAIKASSVPPLPQALLRLMQRTDDDACSIDELTEAVQQDPGLSAHVLTAANSAALRRNNPIHDIRTCVSVLGTRLIRSIATCLAVQRLFDDQPSSDIQADLSAFWRHSLLVAETAQGLAKVTHVVGPDEAYLAGLLHNIGIPLLLGSLGQQYAELLLKSTDEDALVANERATLGTHHGEIGTWLADQWRLDSALGDAILFHHAPADQIATATPLPQIVWFADQVHRNPERIGELAALADAVFDARAGLQLEALRQGAIDRATVIAQAIGLPPPAAAEDAKRTVPRVVVPPPRLPGAEADQQIGQMLGQMSMMHPLQDDLFGIESDADLLLSLRESARILFELPKVGFLLADPRTGELSGREVGGQPTIFAQSKIAPHANAGVVTRAVTGRTACSVFDDLNQAESLLDRQFARAFSTEGILAVPMLGKRRTVGTMVFGVTRGQHGRLKRRTPWLLNFGRIAGVSLEALQDAIAIRKQAEDEAAAAFRQQARRVVHEAGNPLGIIKSYLRILDHKLPSDSGVKQELDVLREEIDRVASIVRNMSEMPPAAQAVLPAAPKTSCAELVRELLALYATALFRDRGIEVAVSFPDEKVLVACDRDSLKQILLNLWKNASEAMSKGGRFEVSVFGGILINGRGFAEIRLGDTGPGMPDAAIQALSCPDRVKSDGDRGHGLAIVGQLAARIGCTISCRSKPGAGTTLSLLLPLAAE